MFNKSKKEMKPRQMRKVGWIGREVSEFGNSVSDRIDRAGQKVQHGAIFASASMTRSMDETAEKVKNFFR